MEIVIFRAFVQPSSFILAKIFAINHQPRAKAGGGSEC